MLVGKRLGPFLVQKELGSGAMGAVYRGIEDKTGRLVAIKIIAPGLASNETAIERFLRESSVLKRLKHPNIAKYLGSGRYHGTPFYIMEYIEGESLDHILARRGRITWEEVVTIGTQLCGALQEAHDEGIIHRDLKPSNLMILPDGTMKLTDFGIAKDTDASALTATHSTLGTAAYMSPEQCRGARDITSKSDLYSMGVMFYELVTGKKPFTSDNPMDVFLMHVKGKFARPSTFAMDLPVWMDTLICHLMEKEPDKRPYNASKVAEELQSIAKKVADQTSAGIDRATKRRADRTTNDIKLDATDKDIARTLLGKRKKKRTIPLYARNGFTLAALGGVVLAMVLFVYLVFIKAPGAESLFQQAGKLMASEKLDDHKEAKEPIHQFLEYHPNHAKTVKVKAWRDQLELEMAQFYVRNERRGAADPREGWEAVEDEKLGRFEEASVRWKKLVPLKTHQDPDQRGWGLLAEKSLQDMNKAESLGKELEKRVRYEIDWKEKVDGKTEAERLALDALRNSLANDRKKAMTNWDDLKRHADGRPELRPYYLLALQRLRE